MICGGYMQRYNHACSHYVSKHIPAIGKVIQRAMNENYMVSKIATKSCS